MKTEERRREIVSFLGGADSPVTAGALSEKFGVSRQIIVGDIAIIRANGTEITSTNRGYVLKSCRGAKRVFKCRHSLDELAEECYIIIGCGGEVEDVFVNHRIYGKLTSHLGLKTATHVEELYRSLASGASKPLMSVTDGYHYHTVSAADESVLDEIGHKLRERGFLIET